MAVALEGGCSVSDLREGHASERGSLKIWPRVDRGTGSLAISLRVLEFGPGLSPGLRNAACDEVLFVLDGEGVVRVEGHAEPVGPSTGVYLRPGACLTVENAGPGPMTVISSRCPDPGPQDEPGDAMLLPAPPPAQAPPFVRLWEQPAEATGDRWYRVLIDQRVGSRQVTQFVGSIPPGRAPDHFHPYEEVLVILSGSGRMWAGSTHAPVAAGSCIFLPRTQVHCVENTGQEELRLLGVFYPAGSPAVRYSAD